jgi:hypothetical protein
LLVAVVAALPARGSELDWCAPLVVRPDTRFVSTNPCAPWWTPETIGAQADFVFDGAAVPSSSTITPAASATYHAELRSAAAAAGRSLVIVLMARFDLVSRYEASAPGFDPAFLVHTAKPWREVTDFFTLDRSPPCACSCRFDEAPGASLLDTPPEQRLRGLIDAAGGVGTYEQQVLYGGQPGADGTREAAPRLFFATSALADQRNPAYRAWKIGLVRQILAEGDFDAVSLNEKFFQYLPGQPAHWWGGPKAGDVAEYLDEDDTLWSAPPLGYGYPEYVAGWAALSRDLRDAGVPYTVTLGPFPWRAGSGYDDPSTPIDEAASIRTVARHARYVFLDRQAGFTQQEIDAIVADIESLGKATVVHFDDACGYGGPDHPELLPKLTARVTVAPNAGDTLRFATQSITAVPGGSATGSWDANFWCDCPRPPCGEPDASATGIGAASWQPVSSLCDATWRSAPGPRRPRVEIRRDGAAAQGTDLVTLCLSACGDGADNDDDGAADFPADAGCASSEGALEHPRCDDGRDNDGDGGIDFDGGATGTPDAQCKAPSGDVEAAASSGGRSCGLGFELGPAVALLAALRRRREREARRVRRVVPPGAVREVET